MLWRGPYTKERHSWLVVLPLALLLAACGGTLGDSVTGTSIDESIGDPVAAPPLSLEVPDFDLEGPTESELPASDFAWDSVIDAGYEANADGTMSESCRRRKVKICYKGKTRKVKRWKAKWYLRRGATLGKCQPSVTCPCFSRSDIDAAAASCASPVGECTTGDPYSLLLTCVPGGGAPPGFLGFYLSQTADGGYCQRLDGSGTFEQQGLTQDEYMACVSAINASGYC